MANTATSKEHDISFKNMIGGDWPIYLVIIGSSAIGFLLYPYLPNTVPIHWGFSGKADDFSSKAFAVLFGPFLNIVTYFILVGAPFIDPDRKNFVDFLKPYRILRFSIHLFLSATYLSSLLIGLGYKLSTAVVLNIGLGVIFIVSGYFMGSFRHNYTVGIRISWTLASPEVWDKTHNYARSIWVGAGIVTILGAFFGMPAGLIIMTVALAVACIAPSVYAYRTYKKLENNKKDNE